MGGRADYVIVGTDGFELFGSGTSASALPDDLVEDWPDDVPLWVGPRLVDVVAPLIPGRPDAPVGRVLRDPPAPCRAAGHPGSMKPRLALALAVGSALVLIALAARGTSPVRYQDRPTGDDEVAPPAAAPPPTLDTAVDGSATAGSLLVFLIVLIVVAVIGVVSLLISLGVFRRRRRRRGVGAAVDAPDLPDEHANPPPILVRRAAEALEELRDHASGPPGDAVIAAWLTLEQAAQDSGVPRQGHQTATEFTGDLLRRYRVDEGATGTLRRVYQRARFGTAEVTADDARTATEALEHIVRDLR